MLQALTADAPKPIRASKEADTGLEASLDPAFAALVAQATLALPTPPAPVPVARPEPEPRGVSSAPPAREPLAERPPAEEGRPADPVEDRPTARTEGRSSAPEAAEPRHAAPREAKAAEPKDPETPSGIQDLPAEALHEAVAAEEAQVAMALAAEGAPAAVKQAAVAVAEAAQVVAPQAPGTESGPRGVQAPGLTPAAANASLERAMPGLQLRQASFDPFAPAAPVPLKEFLSIPRPMIEVPAPLRDTAAHASAQRSEASTATPQAASEAPAASSQPATAPAAGAASPQVAAAALQALPGARTEAAAKGTSPSNLAAGPAAPTQATAAWKVTETAALARPHTAAQQLDGGIRWILSTRGKGAELQLHPESLGRVVIKLSVEGSEVHARVWATEAHTLPILQEHRAFLEVSLRDQGLSLGSFDLRQGARGDQALPDAPRSPSAVLADAGLGEAQQELPTLPASVLAEPRLIEVLA